MADAFSDVFANVLDFGAGVGVDDTATIQSVIDLGRPLLFPTGVYRLAGVLTFGQDNQNSLFAAGAILQLEGDGYVEITGINQTFRGLRIEALVDGTSGKSPDDSTAQRTKKSASTKDPNNRPTTSTREAAGSPPSSFIETPKVSGSQDQSITAGKVAASGLGLASQSVKLVVQPQVQSSADGARTNSTPNAQASDGFTVGDTGQSSGTRAGLSSGESVTVSANSAATIAPTSTSGLEGASLPVGSASAKVTADKATAPSGIAAVIKSAPAVVPAASAETKTTAVPRLGFSLEDSGIPFRLQATRIEPASTQSRSSKLGLATVVDMSAATVADSVSATGSGVAPLLDIRSADDLVFFDLRVTGSPESGTLVSVGQAERVTVFGGRLVGGDNTKGTGIMLQESSTSGIGPSRFAAYGVEIKTVKNAVVLGCATDTPLFQSCDFHDCEYSGVVVASLAADRSGVKMTHTAHVRNLNLLACHVKDAAQYVRVLIDTTITGGCVSGCRFGRFTSDADGARVFYVEGRMDGLVVSGCSHSTVDDPAETFIWEIGDTAEVDATVDLMNAWEETAVTTGDGAEQLVVFTTDNVGGLEITAAALALDATSVTLTADGEPAPTSAEGTHVEANGYRFGRYSSRVLNSGTTRDVLSELLADLVSFGLIPGSSS